MATTEIPRPAPAPAEYTDAAPAARHAEAALREEAARLGRYLMGAWGKTSGAPGHGRAAPSGRARARPATPAAELVERYVRAHDDVLREPPAPGDAAVLAFARAHPWSLPLLDAGTAIVPGAPLLRKKLLVMMAILEATPEHAAATLPRQPAGDAVRARHPDFRECHAQHH